MTLTPNSKTQPTWGNRVWNRIQQVLYFSARLVSRVWLYFVNQGTRFFRLLGALGAKLVAWARAWVKKKWQWARANPLWAVLYLALLLILGTYALPSGLGFLWDMSRYFYAYNRFYLASKAGGPFELSRIVVFRGIPDRSDELPGLQRKVWPPLPREEAETEFFLQELDEQGVRRIEQQLATFGKRDDWPSEIIEHMVAGLGQPAIFRQCQEYAKRGLEQKAIEKCTKLARTEKDYATPAVEQLVQLASVRRHLIQLLEAKQVPLRKADVYNLAGETWECTGDKDTRVRLACAEALLQQRTNEELGRSVYHDFIGSRHPELQRYECPVRATALETLLQYVSADNSTLSATETLLSDCGVESVAQVARALGTEARANRKTKEYLIGKLREPAGSLLALTAAMGLYDENFPRCMTEREELEDQRWPCDLEDNEEDVLRILVVGLGSYSVDEWESLGILTVLQDLELDGKRVARLLLKGLEARNPNTRISAALVAANIDAPPQFLLTKLKTLLSDPDPYVQYFSALSLLRQGQEQPGVLLVLMAHFERTLPADWRSPILLVEWAEDKCRYVREQSEDRPESPGEIREFQVPTVGFRIRRECDLGVLEEASLLGQERRIGSIRDIESFIYAAIEKQDDPESYFRRLPRYDTTETQRVFALEMLRFVEPSYPVVSKLIELTTDTSPRVRVTAIRRLFETLQRAEEPLISNERLMEVISGRVRDVDRHVRDAAEQLVGEYFAPKGNKFCVDALSHPQLAFRKGAVRCLGWSDSPNDLTANDLTRVLALWESDDRLYVRMSAFQAASEIRLRLAKQTDRDKQTAVDVRPR